jgi:uncharacterized membrane protein
MNDTSNRFQGELNPGEQILWSGQPHQGVILRAADLFFIPFSLLWGGFALFFAYMTIAENAPLGVVFIGTIFGVVGLYLMVGRFFVDMLQRRNTYYALTDKRAIIISGVFAQQIKTLVIQNLPEIGVTARRNGTGTITFGSSHPFAWMYAGSGFPNMGFYHVAPSFEMISDVRAVYQLVKRVQTGTA